jgi:hypothetical protein
LTVIRHLSPIEISKRRKNGWCFHRDDAFT